MPIERRPRIQLRNERVQLRDKLRQVKRSSGGKKVFRAGKDIVAVEPGQRKNPKRIINIVDTTAHQEHAKTTIEDRRGGIKRRNPDNKSGYYYERRMGERRGTKPQYKVEPASAEDRVGEPPGWRRLKELDTEGKKRAERKLEGK